MDNYSNYSSYDNYEEGGDTMILPLALMKIKNYCICKRKKNILYIDQNCFAKFHTGKISFIEYDPELLQRELSKRHMENYI